MVDGKFNIPFYFLGQNHLTIGGQWKNDKLTNTRTLGVNSNGAPSIDGVDHTVHSSLKAKSWALFIEDSLDLTDSFTLTLGSRMDHDSRYGKHYSPRLYGVYNLSDNWTLKGGVSRGFKAPDLVQTAAEFNSASKGRGCMHNFPDFKSSFYETNFFSCYTTGNKDLKPETSTNYEFGFNFQNQYLDTGLTYFHTDFKKNHNHNRSLNSE